MLTERRRGAGFYPWAMWPAPQLMGSLPEDWKNIRGEFWGSTWLEAGIVGEGHIELTTLADLWLKKLAETGLREADPSSGSIPKELTSYYPTAEPLHSNLLPAKLEDSREVIWLRADGRRTERGYKSVTILNIPLRTDTAILAALTSLEANPITPDDLEDGDIEAALKLNEPDLVGEEISVEEWVEAALLMTKLEYFVALLRHFRPEFGALPRGEQVALVRETCKRVNRFLEALQQLTAFLEYGSPDKDLRPAIEDVVRDIRAAELQDIEGLSSVKLGQAIGVEAPDSDKVKRTNSRALHMAKRGRRLLINAFGEEGWRELVEKKRAERNHFLSLDDEERSLIRFAEDEGLPIEYARRLANEVGNTWEDGG
jgi:hypothetical protein